ncbi:MAG: hypothetical protein DHS20C12_03360 [Pseudohongiella sp.]|nr:MAG: hypothetical protein DHS20C12_03360 [Pseudohongiella sp.]
MKPSLKSRVYNAMRLPLCLALLAWGLIPTQLSAQSLQRMFSTPAVRAELDRLRFQIATGVPVAETETEPVIEVPTFTSEEQDVIYALGGSMRKADGSYTVWVNNVAYDQSSLPENMELLSPFNQGKVRIRDSGAGTNFDLKPGQVLNLTTGQLYESYQYQAVLDAAAAEAARVAAEAAAAAGAGGIGTGSVILDSAPVENLLDAAQDP